MFVEFKVLLGRTHLEHQVRCCPGRFRIFTDNGACRFIQAVGKICSRTRTGFDDYLKAKLDQFFGDIGCRRYTLFIDMNFFEYAYFHCLPSPIREICQGNLPDFPQNPILP